MTPTMGTRDWSLLVLLSLLWGGSFLFVGIAVAELPPFTVVLGRAGLAALALLAFVYLSGGRMPWTPSLWAAFLAMGALNGLIPYSLIVWGQQEIDSGLAAILNATTPLWSVLLGHYLSRAERLTPARAAGLVLGFAGVVVLIGPGALSGLGSQGWRQLAVLGAALSYAGAAVYGRRFGHLPPAVAATGQVTGTAVLVLPLALFLEQPWTLVPSLEVWGAILGLSLLSTAVAYLIYFRVLATAGATNLMLVTFLIPVSAVILGILVLGERPGLQVVAGMALIFAGIAAIDGRLASRLARARRRDRAQA